MWLTCCALVACCRPAWQRTKGVLLSSKPASAQTSRRSDCENARGRRAIRWSAPSASLSSAPAIAPCGTAARNITHSTGGRTKRIAKSWTRRGGRRCLQAERHRERGAWDDEKGVAPPGARACVAARHFAARSCIRPPLSPGVARRRSGRFPLRTSRGGEDAGGSSHGVVRQRRRRGVGRGGGPSAVPSAPAAPRPRPRRPPRAMDPTATSTMMRLRRGCSNFS